MCRVRADTDTAYWEVVLIQAWLTIVPAHCRRPRSDRIRLATQCCETYPDIVSIVSTLVWCTQVPVRKIVITWQSNVRCLITSTTPISGAWPLSLRHKKNAGVAITLVVRPCSASTTWYRYKISLSAEGWRLAACKQRVYYPVETV